MFSVNVCQIKSRKLYLKENRVKNYKLGSENAIVN